MFRRWGSAPLARGIPTLGNSSPFAGAATQVVQLGTTHGAAANHFDVVDIGRIEREHAFHPFAEAHLADGEIAVDAAIGAGDAHAFVVLHTRALTFDHADTHP